MEEGLTEEAGDQGHPDHVVVEGYDDHR